MEKIRGKSMCVFSAKGGVGKSITVLNLAGVLSNLNKKVLILDFDFSSGAIAALLNKPFKKTIYDFVDDYSNSRINKIQSYATKYNENISFLASCKDPRQGAKIASNYAEIIIEKATSEYDAVLIDMTHNFSEFNINVLDKADETLLILTNNLLDLKGMRNIIRIFNDAEKTNYKLLANFAVNPYKKYYTLYDIKHTIKSNIDYFIDYNFFLKTIDNYIADGEILTLNKKMQKVYPKVYKAYQLICNDFLEMPYEK